MNQLKSEEELHMLAPMFKNKYMAHALGGYQGHKYLNNEPALKQCVLTHSEI